MENEYGQLFQFIQRKYGYNLFEYDDEFVKKAVLKRMSALNYNQISEYYLEIEYNIGEVNILYESLHVNYSQFFRDSLAFVMIEKLVLPSILSNKSNNSELRIWSAGCSAGQEAYSLAILLSQYAHLKSKEYRYRIFASDISKPSIEKAKIGFFEEHEMDNLKMGHIKTYFTKVADGYVVNEELKSHITFIEFDLLESNLTTPIESIFGGFDLIFCSNLLYYYNKESQEKMIYKMMHSLTDEGYFVSSESERFILDNIPELTSMNTHASVFRK